MSQLLSPTSIDPEDERLQKANLDEVTRKLSEEVARKEKKGKKIVPTVVEEREEEEEDKTWLL
jgi:hypothetical protein